MTADDEAKEAAEYALQMASAPPVKDSFTRLLDLLAGWSQFVQRDGDPDADGIIEDVCDLYQAAGALADTSDSSVSAFMRDRVVPLLLRR